MLSRSLKQRIAATCGALFGMVLLYEVTMLDSKTPEVRPVETVARDAAPARPSQGVRLRFSATAYCKGTTTASGTAVRTGIAAADPDLLPVGSVVSIESLGARYNGIYTVMDTGPQVQGRHVDLYMWSCHEALAFGRRPITLNVLRLGWNPRDSSAATIRSQFSEREAAVATGAAPTTTTSASEASTPVPTPPTVPASPPPATTAPEPTVSAKRS